MMDDIYYSKCLFFVQPGYLHNSLGLFAEPCSQKLLSFPFHPKKNSQIRYARIIYPERNWRWVVAQLPGAYLINWIIRPTKCSFDRSPRLFFPISKCEWNLFSFRGKISSFSLPVLFLSPNNTNSELNNL